jgi:hypothetical protein
MAKMSREHRKFINSMPLDMALYLMYHSHPKIDMDQLLEMSKKSCQKVIHIDIGSRERNVSAGVTMP